MYTHVIHYSLELVVRYFPSEGPTEAPIASRENPSACRLVCHPKRDSAVVPWKWGPLHACVCEESKRPQPFSAVVVEDT
jgi:hypothetical protein